jgi:hypothetical protein
MLRTTVFLQPQIFVYINMISVLTSSSQENASCFLFHVTYKLDMWKFTELHYKIVEDIIIFQYNHHICWHSSSTFEQDHVTVEVSFPAVQF